MHLNKETTSENGGIREAGPTLRDTVLPDVQNDFEERMWRYLVGNKKRTFHAGRRHLLDRVERLFVDQTDEHGNALIRLYEREAPKVVQANPDNRDTARTHIDAIVKRVKQGVERARDQNTELFS